MDEKELKKGLEEYCYSIEGAEVRFKEEAGFYGRLIKAVEVRILAFGEVNIKTTSGERITTHLSNVVIKHE